MKPAGLIARIAVTAILTTVTVTAFCQKNLLPGTVITAGGDTLAGQIDYRNWGANPDRVRFTDAGGNIWVFTPAEVKWFTVKDEVYVGAVVNTENSPSDLGSLQMLPDYKLDVDTVFLQAIFEGDRSLYFLKNRTGCNNFYIGDNHGYELLLYKKYMAIAGGQQIVAEVKGYINQLLDYFDNNEALSAEIGRTGYDWGSLERLFRHYYSLTSDGSSFSKKSEKVVVKPAVFAGLSLTTIILRSDYYSYLELPDYKTSADFCGGIAVDLVFPRNLRKWSFNNELQWSSWGVSGQSFASSQDGNITYKNDYDLSMSYINLNSMLRYNYPAGSFIIFVNAGISNGFAVGSTNVMVEELTEYTITERATDSYVKDMRMYKQSLLLGSGIRYGKFFIEYRHEWGSGITINTAIFSSSRINTVWLGYTF